MPTTTSSPPITKSPDASFNKKIFPTIAKSNLPSNKMMSNFNQLLNAINEFNEDYVAFVDCQAENYYNNVSDTCSEPDVSKIVNIKNNNGINYFTVDSDNNLSFNPSSISQNDLLSKNIYDENNDSIDQFHKNIISLRNDLDIKLNKLYHTNTSVLSDYKMEFDNSIYTGILWTILASSILYYLFTKI